jgi:hypothetical protein
MSVTILPYIDTETTQAIREATKSSAPATLDEVKESFQTYLDNATRAQKALAVDALIGATASGSVSVETAEKILGFNPLGTTSTTASTSTDTTDSTDETTTSSSSSEAASTSSSTSDTSSSSKTSSTTTSSSSSGTLSCSSKLQKYFEEAAEKYNVDVNLLKAIAKAESNFDASATSSAGAMGIMQLMPSTAKSLGISNAYDARSNIMGGAKVIAQHLKKYNGDVSLALAAYNAGSGAVDKYGGIPPYTETQNYVKKVLKYYKSA